MAEVVQITRPYESPYVCDACGADRTCQCKSRGVSRNAWNKIIAKVEKNPTKSRQKVPGTKTLENIEESDNKGHLDIVDELERICEQESDTYPNSVWDVCKRAAAEIRKLREELGG